MSFVHLGADSGSRPTFFEVYAADRLAPSLKAALIYSLSVVAQRRQWVQYLVEAEDELFLLLSFVVDHASLQSSGATFAESLYGLRRTPASQALTGVAKAAIGDEALLPQLSRRQQLAAVTVQVRTGDLEGWSM